MVIFSEILYWSLLRSFSFRESLFFMDAMMISLVGKWTQKKSFWYNKSMYTKNEEELQALGERLGHLLAKNDVLILIGELGAGKTTFTKGLAKGLQISQMIKSPTYTIVREYEGRLPLYHLDVYRIEGDADSIDLDEFIFGGGVTVIEWGNLLGDALPDAYLELEILKEADGRRLNFQAKGLRAEKLSEELQYGV
ncbi:putative ATPase [Streptococcus pneumoniae]|nr:putative ATPase [Streptococcus pneumoniae]